MLSGLLPQDKESLTKRAGGANEDALMQDCDKRPLGIENFQQGWY